MNRHNAIAEEIKSPTIENLDKKTDDQFKIYQIS